MMRKTRSEKWSKDMSRRFIEKEMKIALIIGKILHSQ